MSTTREDSSTVNCPSCSTSACSGEIVESCDGHCTCESAGDSAASGMAKVRLDLPVASRRNAMSAFEIIGDKLDGIEAISPADALAILDKVIDAGIRVGQVKLSGPGDPMATPVTVLDTLSGVKQRLPKAEVALVTNGLGVAEHADELYEAGVSHVTLMVDSLTPHTVEKLYKWIRPGKRTLSLDAASAILVGEQLAAAHAVTDRHIRLTVRATLYPDINADDLPEVARAMADCGATSINLIRAESTSDEQAETVRSKMGEHLPVTLGGTDCPEHLVDLASLPEGQDLLGDGSTSAAMPIPSGDRALVAVASEGGMDIDSHLGQAPSFLIYGPATGTSEEGMVKLLETRAAPPPGGGAERWRWLAHTLRDCAAVLVAGAGERPREVLAANGIRVVVTDGEIEGTVDRIYGGGKKGRGRKK